MGQGGTGAVYRAIDQRLGHTVAVKQILHDARMVREAFEYEARLLARLRHPGLPKVSDYFTEEAGQFLVMEFIPGDDLAQAVAKRSGPFPLEQVLDWAAQLLDILVYLHNQRPAVIHRDIKPHNLKLIDGEKLILLDFGLAKGFPEQTDPTDSIAGYTLRYAPPEQIQEEGTDARSDLYAAAATLYDLMVEESPPSALHRLTAQLNNQPDPLRPLDELDATIPPPVSAVLHKALALDPGQRFATAVEMGEALRVAGREEEATELVEPEAATPVAQPPAATGPHNLPAQLTPLIGRKREIETLRQWLQSDDTRLVTLTGPGGIGKTRLSLEVAETMLPHFENGVFFVDLAPVRDPQFVASAIAQTLDIGEGSGRSLLQSVIDHLHSQEILLVLDNFEQIVSAATLITDLLERCRQLKIIVTSREVLRLRGEQEFTVPPLAVPDPEQVRSADSLSHYEAIALFIQRAGAAKPTFTIDDEDVLTIVEICRQLDGLPLAIELTAARIKLFSPQALLKRLEDRFKVLRGGSRDLPVRQQTLHDAIDWSYNLLTEDERLLFRRVAVFAGGHTIEAAETVCDPQDDDGVAPLGSDILDGITSLLDKSLLRQNEGPGGEYRFTMLSSIHDYASRQLAASEEAKALRRRHATYYLELAETAEPQLEGAGQAAALNQLEAEHDNLQAVLHWASENSEAAIAMRLCGALWQFWDIRGYFSIGRRLLAAALALAPSQRAARVKALYGAGVLALRQGAYSDARALQEESLALARQLGDKRGVANALNTLANISLYKGDYDTARSLYSEALDLWQETGNRHGEAVSLGNLGIIMAEQGDHTTARAHMEDSLAIRRQLGDQRDIAESLHNLGEVAYRQEDYAAARTYLEESLAIRRNIEDRWGISYSLHNLGQIAYHQDDYAMARSLLEESLAIKQELGDKWGIAYVFFDMGEVAFRQGDRQQAMARYKEALRLRNEFEDTPGMIQSLEGIIRVTAQTQPTAAARLLGAVAGLRGAEGDPAAEDVEEYQAEIATVRRELGEERFTAVWEDGKSMTLVQAANYGLSLKIVS